MHFQVHKNVIPLDIVNQIVDFFNKNDDIKENKNYMEKINKPWQYPVVNQLDKILKNTILVKRGSKLILGNISNCFSILIFFLSISPCSLA